MRMLYFILGLVSLGLGFVGTVVPVFPAVPFMFVAAACFARSSKSFHDWLVNHPTFGPPIADWQKHRAVSRRSKWLAVGSIVISLAFTAAIGVPIWALGIQGGVMAVVAVFVLTRPHGPQRRK